MDARCAQYDKRLRNADGVLSKDEWACARPNSPIPSCSGGPSSPARNRKHFVETRTPKELSKIPGQTGHESEQILWRLRKVSRRDAEDAEIGLTLFSAFSLCVLCASARNSVSHQRGIR